MATDQRASPKVDDAGNTVVSNYKLVTLEVTPRLAEKITVAQALGTISLSLRSLSDNAEAIENALASGSIKIPKGATPEQEEKILKSLAQRPSSGATSYTTGGDVSRFQPRQLHRQPAPKTPIQVAVEAVHTQKAIEKAIKGPVVRVSRGGGNPEEVEVRR